MILVTGASGLLGANFVAASRERGQLVTALYHRNAVHPPDVQSWPLDLTDPAAVKTMVEKVRPDWIVHCAAITDVDWSERHPQVTNRVNVDGSRALAEAARASGARFSFVSTDAVFSGEQGRYAEDEVPRPINVYAQSKLAGETAVRTILPGALVVRTNLYGWNVQPKRSLAEWVVNELSAGRPITGWKDVRFTPVLANDLCDAMLDMMDRGLEGIYHVAGGDSCTKYDFACAVANHFGLDAELVQPGFVADYVSSARRPRDTSLVTAKIQAALGRPMPSVQEGLARFRQLRDSGFMAQLKACGEEQPCRASH